jgi:hypothetical protein
MKPIVCTTRHDRRAFIGGSDARIIMGSDESAPLRLWQEKRGELEPEDLSGNLIVQLGLATEELNRRWYETNSGHVITDVQRQVQDAALRWMAATLDGRVEATGGRYSRPNSCCPGRSRRKRRPRNMWPSCSITCGSWLRRRRRGSRMPAPSPAPHVTAERKFLREPPRRRSPNGTVWKHFEFASPGHLGFVLQPTFSLFFASRTGWLHR